MGKTETRATNVSGERPGGAQVGRDAREEGRFSAVATASFLRSWAFYRNREWIRTVVSRLVASTATWRELERSNPGVDVGDVVRRNRIMGMIVSWEREGYIEVIEAPGGPEPGTLDERASIAGISPSETSSLLLARRLGIHTLLSDSVEAARALAVEPGEVRHMSSFELLKEVLAARVASGRGIGPREIEASLRGFVSSVGPLMDEAGIERMVMEICEMGRLRRVARGAPGGDADSARWS
ncbi:MAG: hypothetical protein QW379_08805 [Thermoplasmata archaeon]